MPVLPWFQILLVSYVAWVILAIGTLLGNRRSPTATLAWIFAFVALPGISGLYYMVFGPRRMQRRKRRYGVARSLASQVSEYLRGSACAEKPRLEPEALSLATVGKRLDQGEPTFASAVRLLDTGDETMDALEEAIAAALHHVHLEYYIWEPDRTGKRFRDLLAKAAARGIEVRVLCDAVGSSNLDARFWSPLTAAAGEVRRFNPVGFSLASLNFANFRTHRKIVVVDGHVGFVGGVNLHDPACARGSGASAWHDQHVRIDGEPVRKLQRLFLENWTYSGGNFGMSAHNVPLYFPSARGGCGSGVAVQILASGPDDERPAIHAFFLAALAIARRRVWIETPYLIPDEPLEAALRITQLRGIDVQVIVPKQGDSRLVTAASNTYCEALSRAGVVIYQYGPPMLHAKTLVVDETVAMVATANLDNRSFRLNFEAAAAFYDRAVIAKLAARFEADRSQSKPFPFRVRHPRLTMLADSLARLTSPIL